MKKLLVSFIWVVTIVWVEGRQQVLHRVGGGKNTWEPGINFTSWSCHEHFYVGDWLSNFGFDKRIYNVLEVNEASYEDCIDEGFITSVTRGGRDVFNLTDAKTYYFIYGRGYCSQGMKVAVCDVEEPPSSPPAPLVPAKSSGYPGNWLWSHLSNLSNSDQRFEHEFISTCYPFLIVILSALPLSS